MFSDLDQDSYESADSDRNPVSDPGRPMKLSPPPPKIRHSFSNFFLLCWVVGWGGRASPGWGEGGGGGGV